MKRSVILHNLWLTMPCRCVPVILLSMFWVSTDLHAQSTVPRAPSSFCIADSDDCASESNDQTDGGAIKWNPGPYIQTDAFHSKQQATTMSIISEICAMPNAEGMNIRMRWSQVEPARNKYDWTFYDQAYNALAACGKRLIVQIQAVRFDECGDGATPDYIRTAEFDGGVAEASPGYCYAMLWKRSVMDRYLAMKRSFANKFEHLEFFEGSILSETAYNAVEAVNSAGFSTKYSGAAFITQLKRAIDASVEEFPTSNLILYFNYMRGASLAQQIDLMEYMRDNRILFGGPDILPRGVKPSGTNPGSLDKRGRTSGQKIRMGHPDWGGHDFRDEMGCMHSVQPPEMGGRSGNYTVAELFNESNNELKCVTMWWYKNWQIDGLPAGDTSGDEANWNGGGTKDPAGLKIAINKGRVEPSGEAARCPANYTEGCM